MALVLAASGCGSSTSRKTSSAAGTSATVAQTSGAGAPASAPTQHLSILSPRAAAHTASTFTVRVTLSGATNGAQRFRYVLDHRLARSGSARLTFHDLAPGRHRLEVLSAADSTVRASTTFTVRAPAPVAIPAPVPAQPTVSTPAPAPTTTTAPPRTPPPTKTTAPALPKASPPPASGGIPQGPNAGDGDGDNSGGTSDGDGNI
ncbi:MAG: hypothetical protein WAU42_10570 [Solirubrobacteraceae bacterium]